MPVTEPDIEPNIFAGAVRSFELALTPAEPAPKPNSSVRPTESDGR